MREQSLKQSFNQLIDRIMYHESKNPFQKSYYDTIEEMPKTAKVYFPDKDEPVEMTTEQMLKLSREGWFTIMHSCNYGVCDHWTSVPLSKWVYEKFNSYWQYTTNGKADGETLGYNRKAWSVRLTRDSSYRASEVWNS